MLQQLAQVDIIRHNGLSLFELLSLSIVDGWQEVLNYARLPIVDSAVSLFLVFLIVSIVHIEPIYLNFKVG
jgi:hypothetical protein